MRGLFFVGALAAMLFVIVLIGTGLAVVLNQDIIFSKCVTK